jgi:hypothetical protein
MRQHLELKNGMIDTFKPSLAIQDGSGTIREALQTYIPRALALLIRSVC